MPARQGLNIVASTLVLQARSEIDAGSLDNAEALLADARAIDASSADLAATAVALAAARDAVAATEARRQAEERSQAEADHQAELDRQTEADRLAAEASAEQEREAAVAALLVTAAVVDDTTAGAAGGLATESVEQAAGGLATGSVEQAAGGLATGSVEQAAAGPGSNAEEPVATAEVPEPVVIDIRDQTPITMSALTRTRYVAPKYPRTAQRRGVQGWVDVVFTVSREGTVKDLEVRKADPEDVFNNSAMRAVEKWEFEPIVENGVVVERRAGVRMMFALE